MLKGRLKLMRPNLINIIYDENIVDEIVYVLLYFLMEILELKILYNREKILKTISELEKSKVSQDPKQKNMQLSENYNNLAVICLNDNNLQESLEHLRKAESLAGNSAIHKALVFNTIASFYKKQGKLTTSLKYIERSLSIHPTGVAYINLSSLLNLQSKYEKALEIAMHSIIFTQDEVFEQMFDNKTYDESKVECLAAGYYNLAMQLEYLKRPDEANSYYKKTVEFSDKYLTDLNPLTGIFRQIFEKITQKSEAFLDKKRKSESHLRPHRTKKRVIIKSAKSKSPINKSPSNTIKKAPLTERPPGKPVKSYRKFVKTGMSKTKYLESIIPAVLKEDSSGEDTGKFSNTQTVMIKEHNEISLKQKLEVDKIQIPKKKNSESQGSSPKTSEKDKIKAKSQKALEYFAKKRSKYMESLLENGLKNDEKKEEDEEFMDLDEDLKASQEEKVDEEEKRYDGSEKKNEDIDEGYMENELSHEEGENNIKLEKVKEDYILTEGHIFDESYEKVAEEHKNDSEVEGKADDDNDEANEKSSAKDKESRRSSKGEIIERKRSSKGEFIESRRSSKGEFIESGVEKKNIIGDESSRKSSKKYQESRKNSENNEKISEKSEGSRRSSKKSEKMSVKNEEIKRNSESEEGSMSKSHESREISVREKYMETNDENSRKGIIGKNEKNIDCEEKNELEIRTEENIENIHKEDIENDKHQEINKSPDASLSSENSHKSKAAVENLKNLSENPELSSKIKNHTESSSSLKQFSHNSSISNPEKPSSANQELLKEQFEKNLRASFENIEFPIEDLDNSYKIESAKNLDDSSEDDDFFSEVQSNDIKPIDSLEDHEEKDSDDDKIHSALSPIPEESPKAGETANITETNKAIL